MIGYNIIVLSGPFVNISKRGDSLKFSPTRILRCTVVVGVLKQRFGNKQVIIDTHYHSLSHLPPATNHVASLRQCYDALECHLRSLEANGENVNHRHFVALISEKLPKKVLYQLYMQRADGEKWTVPKLRSLLGKHIIALEMAGSESCFTQASSRPSNK